jgi:hypothetical protein
MIRVSASARRQGEVSERDVISATGDGREAANDEVRVAATDCRKRCRRLY